MTRAEKREIVLQLLETDSARSNREIARIAGISHIAVGSIRKTCQRLATLEPAASLAEVTIQKVTTRKLTRRTKVTNHPTLTSPGAVERYQPVEAHQLETLRSRPVKTYQSAESYRLASEMRFALRAAREGRGGSHAASHRSVDIRPGRCSWRCKHFSRRSKCTAW